MCLTSDSIDRQFETKIALSVSFGCWIWPTNMFRFSYSLFFLFILTPCNKTDACFFAWEIHLVAVVICFWLFHRNDLKNKAKNLFDKKTIVWRPCSTIDDKVMVRQIKHRRTKSVTRRRRSEKQCGNFDHFRRSFVSYFSLCSPSNEKTGKRKQKLNDRSRHI